MAIGAVANASTIYCFLLFLVQFVYRDANEASKLIKALSYISIIFMSLACATIALTYYSPRLGSDQCFCYPLWASSLVFYVIALFFLKALYIARTRVLNSGSMFETKATQIGIKVVTVSLSCTVFTNVMLVTFESSGECYSDRTRNGCIARFDTSILYIAMVMISIDSVLFAMFCYKWHKILSVFKMGDKTRKIPVEAIEAFIIQFILTIIAMASCVFDSIFHLIYYRDDGSNYEPTMIAYCIDSVVVATCTCLMMGQIRKKIIRVCKRILCCIPMHELNKQPSNAMTIDGRPVCAPARNSNTKSSERSIKDSPGSAVCHGPVVMTAMHKDSMTATTQQNMDMSIVLTPPCTKTDASTNAHNSAHFKTIELPKENASNGWNAANASNAMTVSNAANAGQADVGGSEN